MQGFFKVLWRINAVLAFIALVLIVGFVVLISKERMTKPLLSYFVPAQAVVMPVVKPAPAYSYVLEKDLLIGADPSAASYEVYRLTRWGKIGKKSAASEATTVNLLVTDKKTKANSWLFKGNDRAIVGQEPMLTGRWYWHEPQVDDDIPVELVVLRVVEADSNGDGALTGADRQTLYVARFAATPLPPEKLLTADVVWFAGQKNKEFEIGYRDHGVGYLATYALPDFTLTSKTEIAGLPN